MTGVFEVNSVEETWELARKLAAELKPGDVICLEGDLGAGKTTFTQGLAAALGVEGATELATSVFTSDGLSVTLERTADGKAKATVAPDGAPPSFFIRVKLR